MNFLQWLLGYPKPLPPAVSLSAAPPQAQPPTPSPAIAPQLQSLHPWRSPPLRDWVVCWRFRHLCDQQLESFSKTIVAAPDLEMRCDLAWEIRRRRAAIN